MILRRVGLPGFIPGQLFLSHMPGRYGTFSKDREDITRAGVGRVICLNPFDEIRSKSPDYARAIKSDELGFEWEHFPLFDLGVPQDRSAFVLLARSIADRLRNGGGLLIHCAGGIGRTATLAVSVLLTLGVEVEAAVETVRDAGAMTQSRAQREFIGWLDEDLRGGVGRQS